MTANRKQGSHLRLTNSHWPWIAVFAAILLTSWTRFYLLDIPLERDEGEYAYAGQLILDGIPPYQLAYNMKLPGTYLAYAAMMAVFGQTTAGIHLGLLVANALTMLFVFLLGRTVFDQRVGVIACVTYGLMAISPNVLGTAAHATHFVVLFAVPGMVMFWKGLQSQRLTHYFGSGILLGCAFLMKQPALFFGLFAGVWLVLASWRKPPINWRKLFQSCGVLLGGFLIPFTIICLWLWRAGVFSKFWFWTFTYAADYATALSFSLGWEQLTYAIDQTQGNVSWLYLLALAGLVAVWKSDRARAPFITGFFIFSFLASAVGMYFRAHYFILLLPAITLAIGIAVVSLHDLLAAREDARVWRKVPLVVFLLIFGTVTWKHVELFADHSHEELARKLYPNNPFIETAEVAKFLQRTSVPTDRVAVIGSEPQIYFHAHRRSATGYIYTYALMEEHAHAGRMQREFIQEIETAKPEYLVFVAFPYSWIIRPNSERTVFEWYEQFVTEHYERIGLVETVAPGQVEYLWNQDAQEYDVQSNPYIYVYKRRLSS